MQKPRIVIHCFITHVSNSSELHGFGPLDINVQNVPCETYIFIFYHSSDKSFCRLLVEELAESVVLGLEKKEEESGIIDVERTSSVLP